MVQADVQDVSLTQKVQKVSATTYHEVDVSVFPAEIFHQLLKATLLSAHLKTHKQLGHVPRRVARGHGHVGPHTDTRLLRDCRQASRKGRF